MDRYRKMMTVTSIINKNFNELFQQLCHVKYIAHQKTRNEVEFFRFYFLEVENMLNRVKINNILFRTNTVEIHQKPIVKYGFNKKCELGDYFISVKFFHNGELIGRNFVIYQVKMANKRNRWTINTKQLELLSKWPSFIFGKKGNGYNVFTLHPKSKDLGSFWLTSRNSIYCYDHVCSALDIDILQKKSITYQDISHVYPFNGISALFLQLISRYGETVEENTNIEDLLNTLYRYVGFHPDPPEEFKGFMTKESEEKSFWGIQICVKSEGE